MSNYAQVPFIASTPLRVIAPAQDGQITTRKVGAFRASVAAAPQRNRPIPPKADVVSRDISPLQ